MGNTCVDTGSGSGSDITCGAGTHLDGTMCVPDTSGPTGAPSISSITPSDAGLTGYVLFTIQGTGFAGDDISSLHVYFGDTSNANCEAQVGTATATTIAGEVPPACQDLNVTVTVTTNMGSATTAFHYDALFAADGDGGGNFGGYGDLYLIDPSVGLYYDMGVLNDGTNGYGLGGMAFDPNGLLWGATTGDSPADADSVSQLVKIDAGSATVTVIGDMVDSAGNPYYVADMKYVGTTLYAYAYTFDAAENTIEGLVTIDPGSGKVTKTTTTATTYGIAGLAVDSTSTMYLAASGAGADTNINATGAFDSVTTAGATTSVATLDYPIGAPINAMTYVGTSLCASVDNGTYGSAMGEPIYGEVLAVIDPTAAPPNPIVGVLFDMPAQLGAQSAVDALDMPPTLFDIFAKHPVSKGGWGQLATAKTSTRPAAVGERSSIMLAHYKAMFERYKASRSGS